MDQLVTDRTGVRMKGGGRQFPALGDYYDRTEHRTMAYFSDRTWLNASSMYVDLHHSGNNTVNSFWPSLDEYL